MVKNKKGSHLIGYLSNKFNSKSGQMFTANGYDKYKA
jgi:hypothetical protein